MSANDELQAHTCEKMLEFYGDVVNNVAQANSQQLTEQWKKGELERGWYYIKKLLKDRVVMDFYYGNDVDRWMDNYDEEIKEVLAPVPSYEEWQELSKQRNQLIRDVKDLAYIQEENQQLRKWCEEFNALEVAEENEALKTKLSIQCKANEELRKENQQLKELLKRCRDFINYEVPDHCIDDVLLDKIDNAIGEKK